jgi:hypothetical protein
MLIWQCIEEKLTLISKNRALVGYRAHGLDFIW